jgi:fumarylacetoacetase
MRAASWIGAANLADAPFPLENLPYGCFSTPGTPPRPGIAIGDRVLDLAALAAAGLVPPELAVAGLRPFMALGPAAWAATRARLTALLSTDEALRGDPVLSSRALVPMASATLHLPFELAEYTDFYASRQHATNVGSMFRGPERALPANWLHLPVGYNGRASTVVVSGTPVRRPAGQLKPPEGPPVFAPSRRLDFELEVGAVVGTGSAIGRRLTTAGAEAAIFGYVLLNDWSARDIQAWEYQPLGPFQSKAFATSIGAWIVPAAALEPFRTDGPAQEPEPLPHLRQPQPRALDVALEVELVAGGRPTTISRSNLRHLYWSPVQQLVHHASSGCAMRAGDLLGSGTVSGPEPSGYGSLLELAWNGREPVPLEGGGSRSFLEDGDEVVLRGHAQGDGYRIGLGECRGRIEPAEAA